MVHCGGYEIRIQGLRTRECKKELPYGIEPMPPAINGVRLRIRISAGHHHRHTDPNLSHITEPAYTRTQKDRHTDTGRVIIDQSISGVV